jgi:hypothetical protein
VLDDLVLLINAIVLAPFRIEEIQDLAGFVHLACEKENEVGTALHEHVEGPQCASIRHRDADPPSWIVNTKLVEQFDDRRKPCEPAAVSWRSGLTATPLPDCGRRHPKRLGNHELSDAVRAR